MTFEDYSCIGCLTPGVNSIVGSLNLGANSIWPLFFSHERVIKLYTYKTSVRCVSYNKNMVSYYYGFILLLQY